MYFTSSIFIAFLAVMFALYYIIPRKAQWVLLLIGSYVFYAWAGLHFLVYVLITTVTTWYSAVRISDRQSQHKRWMKVNKDELTREEKKAAKAVMKKITRRWFLFALLLNLGILAVIKYTNFMIGNINSIFGTGLNFWSIALPMGISFYTFQSMGYLIDVYHGKAEAQRNLGKFALFVSFFPQMVQGPISRYNDLAPSLFGEHKFDSKGIRYGMERVLWGFFKKLVVADRLVVGVKALISTPEQYTGAWVAMAMFLYAIQLYADFTGGIDITIGVAQMFGVKLVENFDRPFFSKDTAEYWRRWHISMGSWFRDYIFYPISVCGWMLKLTTWSRKHLGNVIGKRVPVYLAMAVTWFATGIWHGAAWNFIVWGMLNCLVLIISQELTPFYDWFHSKVHVQDKWGWKLFQILRTFILMSSIRILDCYRNVPLTFHQVGTIFTTANLGEVFPGLTGLGMSWADWVIVVIGTLLMLAVSLVQRRGSVREQLDAKPVAVQAALFAVLLYVVLIFGAYGIGFDANQFIYNQF